MPKISAKFLIFNAKISIENHILSCILQYNLNLPDNVVSGDLYFGKGVAYVRSRLNYGRGTHIWVDYTTYFLLEIRPLVYLNF